MKTPDIITVLARTLYGGGIIMGVFAATSDPVNWVTLVSAVGMMFFASLAMDE